MDIIDDLKKPGAILGIVMLVISIVLWIVYFSTNDTPQLKGDFDIAKNNEEADRLRKKRRGLIISSTILFVVGLFTTAFGMLAKK